MNWKEKIALTGELNDVREKLVGGGLSFPEKIALSNRQIEILELLGVGKDSKPASEPSQANNDESDLVAKFKAGGFNNLDGMAFSALLVDVANEGLDFDGIRSGTELWIRANENKMNLQAAA